LSALAAAPAQAVVIDFNELPNIYQSIGSNYTNQGFTITASYGATSASFYSYNNLSSTSLYNGFGNGISRLTKVGGGAFDLFSIDLDSLVGSNTPTPVTFTGTRADATTVTQTFTTDAVANTLETFNFTNLASVSWTQAYPYHQFDNINVSDASATSVPEPFTVLGTIFGAGYGVALKRKLAKAAQDKEDIS
jgi:hypothetical protein